MSDEVRRYGFFMCESCGRHWESANVYCYKGEYEALYGQECARCNDDVMVLPYRIERLHCPRCGSNMGCDCFNYESSSEDDDDMEEEESDHERHVDPTKAHRSDLCGRCLSGKPCAFDDGYGDESEDEDEEDGAQSCDEGVDDGGYNPPSYYEKCFEGYIGYNHPSYYEEYSDYEDDNDDGSGYCHPTYYHPNYYEQCCR